MPRRKPSPTPTSDETPAAPAVARGATARARTSPARTPSSTAVADTPGDIAPADTATSNAAPAAAPGTTTETAPPPGAIAPGEKAVSRSRAGSLWIAAVGAAVVLILLIVFIAQNSQRVTIHFVGLHGHFSLAIALLVALVGGVLLVAIPGSIRIAQLRHTVKKRTVRR